MTDERWQQLYVRKGPWWALLTLYGLLFWDGFMAVIGVGGACYSLATLLGFAAPLNQPWYAQLGVTVLAGALGGVAMRGVWTALVDLFGGAGSWEGVLDGQRRTHVPGQHGGYRALRFGAADQTWELPVVDAPGAHLEALQAGRTARVLYRKGTRTVMEVWVDAKSRATDAATATPPASTSAGDVSGVLSLEELGRARSWATPRVAWWLVVNVGVAAWVASLGEVNFMSVVVGLLGLLTATPMLLVATQRWWFLRGLDAGAPTSVVEGPYEPGNSARPMRVGGHAVGDVSAAPRREFTRAARARVVTLPKARWLTNLPDSLVVEWLGDDAKDAGAAG
jgi:hypothetical protein